MVSDNGNSLEHLAEIKKLHNKYEFNLVRAKNNKILSNNTNKGPDEVVKSYTLYIQEDSVPSFVFNDHFTGALEIIETDENIDLISFYPYFKYPYLEYYNSKFSEMVFSNSLLKHDHLKFYVYNDQPHFRRSKFF